MIPGGRNFKEIERKKSGRNRSQNRAKTGEKQSSAKFRRVKETLRNEHFVAKPFRNTVEVSARVFRSCEMHCEVEKRDFAPKVPFRRASIFPIYTGHLSCEKGFENQSAILASCSSSSVSLAIQASGHLLRLATSAKVRYPEMARTRGAKSSSPSNRKKSLRKEPVPDSAPEPSQPKAIPPR
ncbi:hypothetical protein CK203_117227 [Vitis vinifera]|uniref:Uncharacterized protein n=1 Tax=Vitis vinifera TaxID=29760 RepID=A0A438DC88_VITVI|nr:hypothetical protein CK203_117227 [Vitis vinifera]